jgi:membrane-bound serine protease (ClpP class)
VQIVQAALVPAIAVVVQSGTPLRASAGKKSNLALIISIDGAIGPAAAGYVKDAL